MKERPEQNYLIDVRRGDDEPVAGFDEQLPETIVVVINHIVDIIVVPYLSPSPWPPQYPVDWERVHDRDEAARFAFATNSITVAPSWDSDMHMQTASFPELQGSGSTAIWFPVNDYDRLVAELKSDRMREAPAPRLFDLEGTMLWDLLCLHLPRVSSLDAYDRDILCLDQPSSPGDRLA
jgi:hypothetical protein